MGEVITGLEAWISGWFP